MWKLNKKNNFGYVLPLTLIILSVSLALLTGIMRKAFVFQERVNFDIKIEQARTLALGGVEVAIAQLAFIDPKEKKESKESGENKFATQQEWLLKILKIINRWQNFNLTKEVDKIDANLQIYISCEQGKINLNKLVLDQKYLKQESDIKSDNKEEVKESFKTESQVKNYIQALEEKLVSNLGISILDILNQLRNKFGKVLIDPTQILVGEVAKKFKNSIFLKPDSNKEQIYLTDLFTVETKTEKLNPWLLSASLCALLGLQLPSKLIDEGKEKILSESVKHLRPYIGWKKDWDVIMEPIYGKKFSSIGQGIDVLFSPEFEATIFSVIVYAKVGNITQRVSAIVEKVEKTKKSGADNDLSEKSMIFKIRKIYWL